MTVHVLTPERERRDPVRRASDARLRKLGWSDYGLLIATLGGLLALFGFVLAIYLSSR